MNTQAADAARFIQVKLYEFRRLQTCTCTVCMPGPLPQGVSPTGR